MTSSAKPIYEIYVDDDRYGVPTLHLVMAEDDDGARGVLERLLGESVHHVGGEVCMDGRTLFRAGSYAAKPRERPASHKLPPLSGRDLIEPPRCTRPLLAQDGSCEGP
ncbi:MAG: hypothetical protein JSR98_01460 [Proteobacteria bacterium]|nr:hypothetical protein [Pseudomonadota bacterium]